MKSFILKTVFVLTALALIPASTIVAYAQSNNADTNFDSSSINCGDEGWLKSALGRFSAAIGNIKYTGNVDKDSLTAMQLISNANLRAATYASKCGTNPQMKAMATKASAAEIQHQQQLKAMQATMGGA